MKIVMILLLAGCILIGPIRGSNGIVYTCEVCNGQVVRCY